MRSLQKRASLALVARFWFDDDNVWCTRNRYSRVCESIESDSILKRKHNVTRRQNGLQSSGKTLLWQSQWLVNTWHWVPNWAGRWRLLRKYEILRREHSPRLSEHCEDLKNNKKCHQNNKCLIALHNALLGSKKHGNKMSVKICALPVQDGLLVS